MRRAPLIALAVLALLAIAACGSSTATVALDETAPSASVPRASAPVASQPPASQPSAAGRCRVSTETGAVKVQIKAFEFVPADVTAGVGETITFTNVDTTRPHTATLHDNSCDVDLDPGESGGLVFDGPGLYSFHCSIHEGMTGLITVE
jgi:plastocyanin